MTDPVTDVIVPVWLQKVPFTAEWVTYKGGVVYFAMLNFEKSMKAHRPIVDLCHCATAGLINGRVLKTVNYKEENFEIKKWKA
jgi:hypothetical protein